MVKFSLTSFFLDNPGQIWDRRPRCWQIQDTACGDVWDCPENFKTKHLLIWPVYVNFTVDEWNRQEIDAYAKQASSVAKHVVMINAIDYEPANHGGAFYFCDGKVVDRLPFDQEGILIVDIDDE